jgi:hypothetical protein
MRAHVILFESTQESRLVLFITLVFASSYVFYPSHYCNVSSKTPIPLGHQTVKHKDNTARFADMASLQRRTKMEQEEWVCLKKHYNNEKDKRRNRKKQKLA